jgi:hypothetical protein
MSNSRREFLQGAVSASLPFLVPRSQRANSFFNDRPLPEFKLGDLVADDWLDEFDGEATEFGEVVGMCYLPQKNSIFPPNTWVYFIHWTHSTCGADFAYPCYDGEPTGGDRLRLITHD